MENKKIKIIIVDDDETARDGITNKLKGKPDIKILGRFNDGEELFEYLNDAKNLKPDIILLDMYIYGDSTAGIRITEELKLKFGSEMKIIIISGRFDQPNNVDIIANAITAGASGLICKIVKTNIYEDIEKAVNCIAKGEEYFNDPILKIMTSVFQQSVKQNMFIDQERAKISFKITDEELKVLLMRAEGYTIEEIQNKMRIPKARITGDMQKKIQTKLEVPRNRVEQMIIMKACMVGLIRYEQIEFAKAEE